MKKKVIFGFLIMLAFIVFPGCNEPIEISPDETQNVNTELLTVDQGINIQTPPLELTEIEIEMLIFTREEEKMARDVYYYFSPKYNSPIFENIRKSEEVHMQMVLNLLEYYEIPDPALEGYGDFTNQDIQELYDDFIAMGENSCIGALTAGRDIEIMDIADLTAWMLQTDNPAIISVFTHLKNGSDRHLAAFTSHLE